MDDDRRREASLMTTAMWGQLSQARAWSHDTRVVREGVEGTMGENKGKAKGNRGRRG